MLTSFLRGLATLTLTLGLVMIVTLGPARAQDPTERVWIQIESYAALGNTEARMRFPVPVWHVAQLKSEVPARR